MDIGLGCEIFTSGDERDSLNVIVNRDREMITGWCVLASDNDIAEVLGVCFNQRLTDLNPCQRSLQCCEQLD